MSAEQTTKHTMVTLHGVPVTIEFHWPYHPSPSGSDWYVLHGKMSLEDGSGRWAAISMHLTQVVKASLPDLGPANTLAPSLCTARKAADTRDIEFLMSNKLQPIPMSSRVFSVVTKEFSFHKASAEESTDYLKRKVYWQQKLGAQSSPVAEESDVLYLNSTKEALLAAAQQLASAGFIKLNGENAVATDALRAQSAAIEDAAHKSVEAIDAKHAYERTTAGH